MEGMRSVLRGSLGRSLRAMREEDRLAAAWHVACGRALAEQGTVIGFTNGVVRLEISDEIWLRQMVGMCEQLQLEMGRIAGVEISGIHFEVKRP